jgi:transposase
MELATKSKREITPENLLKTCWVNGYSVTNLARKFKRSASLVYRAVNDPDSYPKFYSQICSALPRRISDE